MKEARETFAYYVDVSGNGIPHRVAKDMLNSYDKVCGERDRQYEENVNLIIEIGRCRDTIEELEITIERVKNNLSDYKVALYASQPK